MDALLGKPGAKGRNHLVQQDNGKGGNYGLRVGKWRRGVARFAQHADAGDARATRRQHDRLAPQHCGDAVAGPRPRRARHVHAAVRGGGLKVSVTQSSRTVNWGEFRRVGRF